MSAVNKIKTGLKGAFVAASFTYLGLIPQEDDFDPEKDYSASDEQIFLLKKLSEQHDFLLLGDTAHESPYVRLYAQQPEVIDALKTDEDLNIYLEAGTSSNDY